MKRDFDLIRTILLAIEEQHDRTAIYGFSIPDHALSAVGYHCKLLYEHGFISDYKSQYGDNQILSVAVGGLTWEGCDSLEKVRDNSRWAKIKNIISNKCLPLTVEVVKEVVTEMVKTALV